MKKAYWAFLALPLEILFLQVGFYFAGRWLDQTMDWGIAAEIVGPILGFAIWIYHLSIMIKAVSQEGSEGDGPNPTEPFLRRPTDQDDDSTIP